MEKIKIFLAFFLIILGITGGVLTYLIKNESDWITGWNYEKDLYGNRQIDGKIYTYPVDNDSGLTGAAIGTGFFSSSCLIAGVYLLSKIKSVKNDKS
ncbi:MAG: hypothetical protein V1681_05280 [Candidatus Neomarinimicrobiota bacterium]